MILNVPSLIAMSYKSYTIIVTIQIKCVIQNNYQEYSWVKPYVPSLYLSKSLRV